MKINKIINEEIIQLIENFGYRRGDLNTKAEPRGNMVHSNRGTGHFGTGYYFFGDENTARDYESDRPNLDRPVSKINLDGYKLAPATLELHELLKPLNNNNRGNDQSVLHQNVEKVYEYFNALETSPKFHAPRNNAEYNKLSPEELDDIETLTNKGYEIQDRNDAKINSVVKQIEDSINNMGEDSPSTIVMKSLGFEGVDARGTNLDNSRYGSVIYDIKNNNDR